MAKYSNFITPQTSPNGDVSVDVIEGAENLPVSGVLGETVFDISNNIIYVWTGLSGWRAKSLLNSAPTITSSISTVALPIDGSSYTLTLDATDPEGFPILWSYTSDDIGSNATIIKQTANKFSVTALVPGSSFTAKFTASDGANNRSIDILFTAQEIFDYSNITLEKDMRIDGREANVLWDEDSFFGNTVSILGDVAAVGFIYDETIYNETTAGAVYIYKKINNDWKFQTRIRNPSTTAGDNFFGALVKLYDNLLIITSGNIVNGSYATYVYETSNNGDTWTLAQTIENAPNTSGYAATQIAIDNDILILSDYNANNSQGILNIYDRNGSTFSLNSTFNDIPVNTTYFGIKVFLYNDFLFVARQLTPGNNQSGRLRVYERDGVNFTFVQEILSSIVDTYDGFGKQLAYNGQKLYIGAQRGLSSANGSVQGWIDVYDLSNGSFVYNSTMQYNNGNGNFAASIELYANYLFVSAPNLPYNSIQGNGAVYIFDIDNSLTSPIASIYGGDLSGSYSASQGPKFGEYIAVDGRNLIATSQLDGGVIPQSGSVWFYTADPQTSYGTYNGVRNGFITDSTSFNEAGEYTLTVTTSFSATISLWGAAGGGYAGGFGGYTTGTYTFNAGTTYRIIVGGGGQVNNNGSAGVNGGFGGGGFIGRTNNTGVYASSGGGYTGLFTGTVTQGNAVAIAGGGGGSGGHNLGQTGAVGGHGGGSSGSSGGQAGSASGGLGGTQIGGGARGSGPSSYNTSDQGSALQGGKGASTLTTSYTAGGGGGGYFGGGGGGGNNYAGGGGGGGSGYASTGFTTIASSSSTQAGIDDPYYNAPVGQPEDGRPKLVRSHSGLAVIHSITPYVATPDYIITVTNSGNSYVLSGSDRNGSFTSSSQPTLTFERGDIVQFNINSSTSSAHPFYIKTSQSTGTGNQVANVDGQGTTEVIWDTSAATPGATYGYQCSIHLSMWNTITITPEVPP